MPLPHFSQAYSLVVGSRSIFWEASAMTVLRTSSTCLPWMMFAPGVEVFVAPHLGQVRTPFTGRIIAFNTKRDVAAIDEAHRLMTTLRDGWQQIAAGKPGAQGAP